MNTLGMPRSIISDRLTSPIGRDSLLEASTPDLVSLLDLLHRNLLVHQTQLFQVERSVRLYILFCIPVRVSWRVRICNLAMVLKELRDRDFLPA